jgi:hypothetical protein
MIYISGGHYYKEDQAPIELSALLPIIVAFRALCNHVERQSKDAASVGPSE